MERGRSRKARSGCLGRIFGFVLFLIVAAVGVIAAVKYMPSRERADFGNGSHVDAMLFAFLEFGERMQAILILHSAFLSHAAR